MPTTFTGLLLFMALLLPGFTFLGVYTFDRPRRRLTVLQETGAVAIASIVAELVVLAGFLGVREAASSIGRDLDEFVLDPRAYFQAHYVQVIAWSVGLLAVACVLAAITGLAARFLPVHPSVMSSWWVLFERWHPDTIRYVQCELDDGSFVSGVLGDWNTEGDDLPDRDLLLKAPICYRPAKDADYVSHPVSAVSVSDRHIVAMFVAYSDLEPGTTSCPPSAEAEAGASSAEGSGADDRAGQVGASASGPSDDQPYPTPV